MKINWHKREGLNLVVFHLGMYITRINRRHFDFDDVIAEDTQHQTKGRVNEEDKESKHSHGFLRLCDRDRIAFLRSLGEDGEDDEHLLCHDEDDTQKESDGNRCLILVHDKY